MSSDREQIETGAPGPGQYLAALRRHGGRRASGDPAYRCAAGGHPECRGRAVAPGGTSREPPGARHEWWAGWGGAAVARSFGGGYRAGGGRRSAPWGVRGGWRWGCRRCGRCEECLAVPTLEGTTARGPIRCSRSSRATRGSRATLSHHALAASGRTTLSQHPPPRAQASGGPLRSRCRVGGRAAPGAVPAARRTTRCTPPFVRSSLLIVHEHFPAPPRPHRGDGAAGLRPASSSPAIPAGLTTARSRVARPAGVRRPLPCLGASRRAPRGSGLLQPPPAASRLGRRGAARGGPAGPSVSRDPRLGAGHAAGHTGRPSRGAPAPRRSRQERRRRHRRRAAPPDAPPSSRRDRVPGYAR